MPDGRAERTEGFYWEFNVFGDCLCILNAIQAVFRYLVYLKAAGCIQSAFLLTMPSWLPLIPYKVAHGKRKIDYGLRLSQATSVLSHLDKTSMHLFL